MENVQISHGGTGCADVQIPNSTTGFAGVKIAKRECGVYILPFILISRDQPWGSAIRLPVLPRSSVSY